MAKPPNKFLQNLTHSGVVGGGVRAFLQLHLVDVKLKLLLELVEIFP
jgi:hypothetical protein